MPEHIVGFALARHVHQTVISARFDDAFRAYAQRAWRSRLGRTVINDERLRDVQAIGQINEMLVLGLDRGLRAYYGDTYQTAFLSALDIDLLRVGQRVAWLAQQWHIEPPALKFLLIGGEEAVRKIAGDEKFETHLAFFAEIYCYAAPDAPDEVNPFRRLPRITRSQIDYALAEVRKLPPAPPWWNFPRELTLPLTYAGLHHHETRRGRTKHKSRSQTSARKKSSGPEIR